MCTPAFGVSRVSSTSGVLPTRSSSDFDVANLIPSEAKGLAPPAEHANHLARRTTGHGRKQDDRLAFPYRCVEPVERAHVLALDVDVHEGRDLAVVLEELLAETVVPLGEVLQHRAHGLAL